MHSRPGRPGWWRSREQSWGQCWDGFESGLLERISHRFDMGGQIPGKGHDPPHMQHVMHGGKGRACAYAQMKGRHASVQSDLGRHTRKPSSLHTCVVPAECRAWHALRHCRVYVQSLQAGGNDGPFHHTSERTMCPSPATAQI